MNNKKPFNKKPAAKETRFRVAEENDLMTFLLSKMGGMSRNSVKLLLSRRQVLVNNKIETQYNLPLKPNDTILINSGIANAELTHPKLKIIHEDQELIVVEKKEGLLTTATARDTLEVTAFSILKNYVKKSNPRNRIYTIHRLDRETSGILVFGKNKDIQEYMQAHWHQIVTKRTYVALVEGVVEKDHDTITTWLTENEKSKKVYSSPIDNGGQMAITHYKRVKNNEHFSLLELNLETGRKNQIRVHLASIEHPIVGDKKYGATTKLIGRIGLHARILEFTHPGTQERLHFETPVPREFLTVFH